MFSTLQTLKLFDYENLIFNKNFSGMKISNVHNLKVCKTNGNIGFITKMLGNEWPENE